MRSILLLLLAGCISARAIGQSDAYPLKITQLTDRLFVYVSYGTYQGKRYPANALYLVTDKGVVLFDTPWGENYFQPLLDSIQKRHHKKVILCIATHYHADRTGGLDYYAGKGIKTYTTEKTDSLSALHHNPRANFLIRDDTTFHIGAATFETYYPGPGHTPDNIVIWFPKEKVLYGGCLIKSVADTSLGNLEDASVSEWPATLQRLQQKFPDPRYIIVGHNAWTSKRSIRHTLKLLSEYQSD